MLQLSGWRDSNPRQHAWQARTLPTELHPQPSAPGETRTRKPFGRQILSLLCIPFHHKSNLDSSIPLFYKGELTYYHQCHPHRCLSIHEDYSYGNFPCTVVVVSLRKGRLMSRVAWDFPTTGKSYNHFMFCKQRC